jgi:ABC-type antimicrobial peptide transport system permease subunit
MRVVIDRAIVQERMLAQLASWFGVLAFTLGVIGIYGVRSYAVTRRTTEMGIRMALGADAGTIVGLVVRQGLFAALLGTAIGITAAAGLTRFIEGILFRVAPLDPATFAAVTAIFAGTAILASYVPARRAARIDPAVTLRSE